MTRPKDRDIRAKFRDGVPRRISERIALVSGLPKTLKRPEIRSNRSCGSCTACCTTMRVEELDKPVGVTCQHVCKSGCSIYESRPSGCVNWECVWLQSSMADGLRPDKMGLVFLPQKENAFSTYGIQVVGAREVWPWAASMQKGKKAIRFMTSKSISVLLLRGEDGRTLYPGNGARKKLESILDSSLSLYSWNGVCYEIRSWAGGLKEIRESKK